MRVNNNADLLSLLRQLNDLMHVKASQVVLAVKKKKTHLPIQETRDAGLIPGLERSPGGKHGNPLQYFCLENPMDGGAWWATQPIGSQRVRHERSNLASTHAVCVEELRTLLGI